ncbi:hypothetical protein [Amycolatopsis sp. cg9]|uniref:hypothetical protein n=1 Tax=Amycolatopsis sp. cg9 TaxID=3238801 RepID=UPI003523EF85
MTSAVGHLFTTETGNEALFLATADIARLRETIGTIRSRPEVAGPAPDIAALEELGQELDDLEEAGRPSPAPLVTTPAARAWIELLHEQVRIIAELDGQKRLRLHLTCSACGNAVLVNPVDEQAKAARRTQERRDATTSLLAEDFADFDPDHPFLSAFASVMRHAGQGDSPAAAGARTCESCRGTDFESAVVVFCPGCRARRTETVVVACPDCGYDFRLLAPKTELWGAPDEARHAFNLALLSEGASSFESGLWRKQRAALTEALSGHEDLIALCRCGIPGEVGRYVALLFTSTQFVWARESLVSGTTSGGAPWREVVAVTNPHSSATGFTSGLALHLSGGTSMTFNDFRGVGVALGEHEISFDAEGVRRLAKDLQGKTAISAS